MGHLCTCGGPLGHRVAHLRCTLRGPCGRIRGTCSLVHPQSTPRVPCRRSRSAWPPTMHPLGAMQVHPFTTMHPQGAMLAHTGHPITCGVPLGCHACTYMAPGDLRREGGREGGWPFRVSRDGGGVRSKARHSWSQPFHVRRSDGAGSRGRHLPGTWSPHLGTMQLHKGAPVHLQHTPGTWSPAMHPQARTGHLFSFNAPCMRMHGTPRVHRR